ncbi:putative membrane -like isoform X2 isoform A [Micractinium conductrix]|nr:putative membrane -like isoform X2 isoform A [Micractinium conductrix]|eukprot:PSC76722.1 putative membrane -like isoform X2 isoform A [Micractinium conductrix]
MAGSLLAFWLMPLRGLGADGWKVAAALTARHIGGSVNYVAVSEALALSPSARMAGLAADDLIVSAYFLTLYALARGVPPEQPSTASLDEQAAGGAPAPAASASPGTLQAVAEVLHGATALALAAAICFAGTSIATALRYTGGSITVITAITVTLATLFPAVLAPLRASGEGLAAILMQLFFASVGASGSIVVVMKTAPTLFLWSAVSVSTHLGLVLAGERLWGFTRKESCLASNANIGGPTTAAGMAAAKGWHSSLVPALLIGIMGYATATFIGVACATVFRHMQFA